MKGIIVLANINHGRHAAEMDDSEFIAFELVDSVELAPGTVFEANLRCHGRETFRTADGKNFSVDIEILGTDRKTSCAWASS